MALPELFANSPTPGAAAGLTTLSGNGGSIASGAASMKTAAVAPAVLQTSGQFRVLIDFELMLIDASTVNTTTWTILTRGIEGTTAATHNDGAVIYHILTATALVNLVASNPPQAHKTTHEPGGTDALTALTNASIAAGAAIAYSKLTLTGSIVDGDVAAANKDGADGTASMRTLGVTAGKAAGGDRVGWQGVAKSGTFTAAVGQMNYCTGAITGTLPSAPAADAECGFLSLTGTVTVNRGGTDTIEQYGVTTKTTTSVPIGTHIVFKYLSGVWYRVRDTRPLGWNTAARMHAGTAGQTILTGNTTLVNLDSVDFDLGSNLSTGSHTYTAPVTGRYRVSVGVGVNGAFLHQLNLFVGGVNISLGPAASAFDLAYTDTITMNLNDVLDLRDFNNSGSTITVNANSSTFMAVERVA